MPRARPSSGRPGRPRATSVGQAATRPVERRGELAAVLGDVAAGVVAQVQRGVAELDLHPVPVGDVACAEPSFQASSVSHRPCTNTASRGLALGWAAASASRVDARRRGRGAGTTSSGPAGCRWRCERVAERAVERADRRHGRRACARSRERRRARARARGVSAGADDSAGQLAGSGRRPRPAMRSWARA